MPTVRTYFGICR